MSSDLWDVTGTLAEYADCGTPDAVDSPGAEWLRYVAMVFEDADGGLDEDGISELADESVPVYTHKRWLVWTDLMLYQDESVDDWQWDGDHGSGVSTVADSMVCWVLYSVAERILRRLWDERNS